MAASWVPYMWVILCLVGYKLVGERLAAFARARKRSDVTRGHMWATSWDIVTAPVAPNQVQCNAFKSWFWIAHRASLHVGHFGLTAQAPHKQPLVGERLALPARCAAQCNDVTIPGAPPVGNTTG